MFFFFFFFVLVAALHLFVYPVCFVYENFALDPWAKHTHTHKLPPPVPPVPSAPMDECLLTHADADVDCTNATQHNATQHQIRLPAKWPPFRTSTPMLRSAM